MYLAFLNVGSGDQAWVPMFTRRTLYWMSYIPKYEVIRFLFLIFKQKEVGKLWLNCLWFYCPDLIILFFRVGGWVDSNLHTGVASSVREFGRFLNVLPRHHFPMAFCVYNTCLKFHSPTDHMFYSVLLKIGSWKPSTFSLSPSRCTYCCR